MFFGSLSFIFEVMLYVGLGLPLVSFLLSFIGHIGGEASPELEADFDADASFDTDIDVDLDVDVDLDLDIDAGFDGNIDLDTDLPVEFDAPDIHLETTEIPTSVQQNFPLRFNIYCLCLSFVVMGAMGIFALETLLGAAQIAALIGGGVLAVAAYVLLYRLVVRRLKRNNASALNVNSLRFRHALVIFRITQTSPGKIETTDATGARITYPAMLDPAICKAEKIEEGEEIVITHIDKAQNTCYVTLAQKKMLR